MTQPSPQPDDNTDRRMWMSELARARWPVLSKLWDSLDNRPAFSTLRAPESGLVMVRGRTGGSGSPFNLGEASVTRCSVVLASGETGHAYVLGRNGEHARVAAVIDAAMQNRDMAGIFRMNVIDPLKTERSRRDEDRHRRAQDTRVDFFNLVRGEDPA